MVYAVNLFSLVELLGLGRLVGLHVDAAREQLRHLTADLRLLRPVGSE